MENDIQISQPVILKDPGTNMELKVEKRAPTSRFGSFVKDVAKRFFYRHTPQTVIEIDTMTAQTPDPAKDIKFKTGDVKIMDNLIEEKPDESGKKKEPKTSPQKVEVVVDSRLPKKGFGVSVEYDWKWFLRRKNAMQVRIGEDLRQENIKAAVSDDGGITVQVRQPVSPGVALPLEFEISKDRVDSIKRRQKVVAAVSAVTTSVLGAAGTFATAFLGRDTIMPILEQIRQGQFSQLSRTETPQTQTASPTDISNVPNDNLSLPEQPESPSTIPERIQDAIKSVTDTARIAVDEIQDLRDQARDLAKRLIQSQIPNAPTVNVPDTNLPNANLPDIIDIPLNDVVSRLKEPFEPVLGRFDLP